MYYAHNMYAYLILNRTYSIGAPPACIIDWVAFNNKRLVSI